MPTAEDVVVVVRPAERGDIEAIRTIDAQVYPNPWSEKMTIDQVTRPGRLHLVVEADGRVVAHAGLLVLGGDAHISTIAVDPAHQRRGLADVLMSHLFGLAEEQGCAAVTLEVRASNRAAIALYEKHGMVSEGVRPHYYSDNGEDAVIMWFGASSVSDTEGLETDA